MNNSLKSMWPRIIPIGGMMMSFTIEVTIAPKAAPMITATARSRTLPFIMNALNSCNMFVSLFLSLLWHPASGHNRDRAGAESRVGGRYAYAKWEGTSYLLARWGFSAHVSVLNRERRHLDCRNEFAQHHANAGYRDHPATLDRWRVGGRGPVRGSGSVPTEEHPAARARDKDGQQGEPGTRWRQITLPEIDRLRVGGGLRLRHRPVGRGTVSPASGSQGNGRNEEQPCDDDLTHQSDHAREVPCGVLPIEAARWSALAFDTVDRVGELVQVGADGIEESHNRAPADVALADLNARDIGIARPGLCCDFSLREASAGSQVPESAGFASPGERGRNERRFKPATQEDYRWRLERHLLPYFAEMPLDAITFDAVERYIGAKLDTTQPLSPRSINMTVTLL